MHQMQRALEERGRACFFDASNACHYQHKLVRAKMDTVATYCTFLSEPGVHQEIW